MPVRKAQLAPAPRQLSGRHTAFPRPWPVFLSVVLLLALSAAKTPPSGVDPGYVAALAAADHLLQAWHSGDVENGMALLTGHAKETAGTDDVEKFFSNPEAAAYEIVRGKAVKRGRYEFPVVLFSRAATNPRVRRRFSSIIVVNTGNNDWAVDKLP